MFRFHVCLYLSLYFINIKGGFLVLQPLPDINLPPTALATQLPEQSWLVSWCRHESARSCLCVFRRAATVPNGGQGTKHTRSTS